MGYHYSVEVKHSGLNKYRIVKGNTKSEAQAKANALLLQWDEQWKRKREAEKNRSIRIANQKIREQTKAEHEANQAEASQLTFEQEQIQIKMSSLLQDSQKLTVPTWDNFKDNSLFNEPEPVKPKYNKLKSLPSRSESRYNPKLTLIEKLSKKKRTQITEMYNLVYEKDKNRVIKENESITTQNNYFTKIYNTEMEEWNQKKEAFYKQRDLFNSEIENHQNAFEKGHPDSIAFFYDEMITSVKDPFDFDRQVEAYYQNNTKMLLIDMFLPTIEDLPNIKKVNYVKSTGEFKETFHSISYMNQKYDDVIYQTVLQTFFLIFKHDQKYNQIDSAVINGKVNTIDKATGSMITPYILSVSVKKEDFNQLNIEYIDAKTWFKNSKGISAAKIANVTPIAPIIVLNKEDNRFVDGYSVIDYVDDSVNLASMDWQDFENLIRELFISEFKVNGGEVKITQASRDGGVDAVAFDPCPIRGGKIVIQAKRYTNIVGVSAVRDLYGTVMNEGAMKGILITTSNYGNDAYKFAQGKPLTLLNGANLLSMLESHGYKARIDIAQAREQLKNSRD